MLAEVAEVVCVTSGGDALRTLLTNDFAVILLDVFMPGMDGYETASLIRERQQTARIPIIFLSAVNKETEHLMKGYEMGAVDYVFKPVHPMMCNRRLGCSLTLGDAHARSRKRPRRAEASRRCCAPISRNSMRARAAGGRGTPCAAIKSLPIIRSPRDLANDMTPPRIIGGDLAR